MSNLTKADESCIADFRRVRPTARDQRQNPDIDVVRVWRDDIEHSIKCRELTGSRADEFRAACLA